MVHRRRVLDLVDLAATSARTSYLVPQGPLDAASLPRWLELARAIDPDELASARGPLLDAVQLGAPVDAVGSFRDFYAFEEHVKTARARRGLEMVPEWYELPVFYFSNPRSIVGHDAEVTAPASGELARLRAGDRLRHRPAGA